MINIKETKWAATSHFQAAKLSPKNGNILMHDLLAKAKELTTLSSFVVEMVIIDPKSNSRVHYSSGTSVT